MDEWPRTLHQMPEMCLLLCLRCLFLVSVKGAGVTQLSKLWMCAWLSKMSVALWHLGGGRLPCTELGIVNAAHTDVESRFETDTQRGATRWPHLFILTLITVLETVALENRLLLSQTFLSWAHQVIRHIACSIMDPALDHIRPRGWRNSHFQQVIVSPFQPSYRPIYHAFSPPPPIPPAGSMPVPYYHANGFYHHTPQYSGLPIAWNRNMDNYDARYSMSPTYNRGYQHEDK